MKRSNSSEFNSEPKRFETAYPPPSQFQQQQQLQMQAQHQQQYQAQQQFQQQMQAQQIQAVQQQQQQQFAANQQFFNPAAAFYPMNSVNYSPYVPAQSPMMYNSSPSWNFMPSPSPFFNAPPAPVPPGPPSQPPLPPPDLKPEKPPLPKEPEPGCSSTSVPPPTEAPPVQQLPHNGVGRPPGPTLMNGVRMRGGMNGGFNGFNPAMNMRGLVGGRPSVMGHNGMAMRGRRRNAHFFPQMPTPQMIVPPMELHHMGEIPDFARLLEEDQPAGPEKLTIYLNNNDTGRVQVNKKAKRKPMSTRYTRTKMWVREEAEAAIALEKEFNRMQKRPMLILKFPDPDLNKFIVKKYSPSIDSVHFQQPSTPRYCFVQLKEDADVEKVMNTIRQIPFGSGTITCELKNQLLDDQPVTPEEIDPYTLYIGNLPTHISVRVVKQYFPNAQRIDIGYAQRMRYTRYAFIRYNSVAEAMDSYKRTVNALLDSRSLIVRFRRQKGNIGLPGETKLNAPRREGREVLPETAPKPLDHEDEDMHILETFETEMETVQIDEDDEDLEEEEDDNAQPEEAPSTSPKKIELNTKTDPSTATRSSLAVPDVEASDEIICTSDTAPNNTNPNDSSEASTSSRDKVPSTLNPTNTEAEDKENKDRVIEEANAIIQRNAEAYRDELKRKFIEKELRSIPQLTSVHSVSSNVKLEDDDSDDSSNDGINYLGTRVKEEPGSPIYQEPRGPVPPHIFLEDSHFTGDEDDDEPEEEDDAIEDGPVNKLRSKGIGQWDAMRHDELNEKEDKPDLHQIGSLSNFESSSVLPIPAFVEPKTELEDEFDPKPKKKKRDTDMIEEKDDLTDMFRQMNSDPEFDDEDSYFGSFA